MLLREDKIDGAEELQQRRSAAFGAATAKKIRPAAPCRFSLLPHEHLARLASGWYEAAVESMLSGNYVELHAAGRSRTTANLPQPGYSGGKVE